MIKGLFKLVFGIIAAVIVTGLIVFVTFAIGRGVTGSWNPAEWGKSESGSTETVAAYQYEYDTVTFDNCTVNF